MNYVYILTTKEKIIAVYSTPEIAEKMISLCEERFKAPVTLITKILDPDFNIVGNNELDKE